MNMFVKVKKAWTNDKMCPIAKVKSPFFSLKFKATHCRQNLRLEAYQG